MLSDKKMPYAELEQHWNTRHAEEIRSGDLILPRRPPEDLPTNANTKNTETRSSASSEVRPIFVSF